MSLDAYCWDEAFRQANGLVKLQGFTIVVFGLIGEATMYRFLWAKSDPFHPLWCHLIDVGAVARKLWDEVYPESWKKNLSRSLGLPLDQSRNFAVWLAAMHDLGKASPQFQNLHKELASKTKEAGFPFPRLDPLSHGDVTAQLLALYLKERDWPNQQANMTALCAAGHHGIPPTDIEEMWPFRLSPTDLSVWRDAQHSLIADVENALGLQEPSLPASACSDPSESARVALALLDLAGFISFADWIGSSDSHFSSVIGGQIAAATSPSNYARLADVQARKALDEFGWRSFPVPGAPRDYTRLFIDPARRSKGETFVPRPLQSRVADLLAEHPDIRFLLIEAPMGEGKTEAALYAARHWLEQFHQRGVYLALPSQATSNAMYDRFTRWFEHLAVGNADVLLLHGGFIKPEQYEQIVDRTRLQLFDAFPGPGNIDQGREPNANAATAHEWFLQSKRGLLAPFGVGTIDQALLAVLRCRHHFVRLHGLAGKTVIFDEVHAYDTYTGKLLDRLLEYLRALDCTVILLTATLPFKRRRELVGAFTGRSSIPTETSASPSDSPYPRILASTSDADLPPLTFATSESSAKTVALGWLPNDLDAALLEFSERLGERGCGAFVFNTVSEAQTAYRRAKELFGDSLETLTILHSRFPFGERQRREQQLLELFGKGIERRPRGRALVVATQVIEQSLDLDFDLMASEIAPIDLLLQRTGRLHRHARPNRPAPLASPRLLIRQPAATDASPGYGGSGYVYGTPILMRTHALLLRPALAAAGLKIPDQVEEMIEAVYSGSVDSEIPDAWKDDFAAAMSKWEGQALQQSRNAVGRTLVEPRKSANYWEHIGEFTTDDENASGLHPALRPMTRLGENAVRVLCLFQGDGGVLYFDPDRRERVETRRPPDSGTLRRIFGHVATLSTRQVRENEILEFSLDLKPPAEWRTRGVLRNLPILAFRPDRVCELDTVDILWDEEVGIEYRKKKRRR